jgi:hypothetical protein
MDLFANSWLVNFTQEDIPSMSAAEIVHRLVALREIENAPHFMYTLKLQGEVGERVIRRDPETLDGYTRLRMNWLMEEMRRRGLLGREFETKTPVPDIHRLEQL